MKPTEALTWFLIPRRDKHYQWWWGYQKVRMCKLGKKAQEDFYNSMNAKLEKAENDRLQQKHSNTTQNSGTNGRTSGDDGVELPPTKA